MAVRLLILDVLAAVTAEDYGGSRAIEHCFVAPGG